MTEYLGMTFKLKPDVNDKIVCFIKDLNKSFERI